jgi:hypothetical protein
VDGRSTGWITSRVQPVASAEDAEPEQNERGCDGPMSRIPIGLSGVCPKIASTWGDSSVEMMWSATPATLAAGRDAFFEAAAEVDDLVA